MERVYNFAAGPATIDPSVLEKAQKELVCYQDKGMSVMEMSHRSAMYLDIYNETEALLRQLMGIPENYKVLFLQGGATLQFSAVPLNLMGEKNTADYADTGNFAHLAAEEAKNTVRYALRLLPGRTAIPSFPVSLTGTRTQPMPTSPPTTPFTAPATPLCPIRGRFRWWRI